MLEYGQNLITQFLKGGVGMKCENKELARVGNSNCFIFSKVMLEQANFTDKDKYTINIKKDLVTIRKQKEN